MATVTTSGIWTSVQPTPDRVQGMNTNLISWGVPYTAGGKQSSYQFDGVAGATAPLDGAEFKLGTFTHHNWFLAGSQIIFVANLKVTLSLGGGPSREFNFGFRHNETPAAPDEVDFPAAQAKETVTIDGGEYTLEISGFRQGGQTVAKFISQENRSNSAGIFARLVPVARPETKPPVIEEKKPPVIEEKKPPVIEEQCRVKQVVGVSTVFAAVLERLNRRSVVHVLEQVIAEVNEHCEKGPGVKVDIDAVLQQIETLNLKLQLIQEGAGALERTEIGKLEELLRKLLLTMDLGDVIQNIRIDVDGRTFDLRRLVEVTSTVEQVVNIRLQYTEVEAGDLTGVTFTLTDGTRVTFRARAAQKDGDTRVVYVFETADWKGLPATFSLVYTRRSRALTLCKRRFDLDVFDGVEQTNVVFDLCPRIRRSGG